MRHRRQLGGNWDKAEKWSRLSRSFQVPYWEHWEAALVALGGCTGGTGRARAVGDASLGVRVPRAVTPRWGSPPQSSRCPYWEHWEAAEVALGALGGGTGGTGRWHWEHWAAAGVHGTSQALGDASRGVPVPRAVTPRWRRPPEPSQSSYWMHWEVALVVLGGGTGNTGRVQVSMGHHRRWVTCPGASLSPGW